MDSSIDPELQVVATASDEDESDNETSSRDLDPTLLAREFIECNNCEEEKEDDKSGEGEGEELQIPERCGCSKSCFALFENKLTIGEIWLNLRKMKKKFYCRQN